MGLAVKVALKDAERVRKQLIRKRVFLRGVERKGDFLYIPVTKKVKGFDIVTFSVGKKEKITIDGLLRNILTKNELEMFPRAHDVIGDILILEVQKELERKEKKIAEAYLKCYKNVKTVVKKSAIHSGVFRTRKLKVLAGENKKATVYKENGLRFKVHLEKMYFSSRLAHERLRIAQQVRKGEEVLVMFSGCAPYCCVIAKHSPAKVVYGVEINPLAHEYGAGNVQMNKLWDKVKLYEGDVWKIVPTLKKKFDRIVMPLPKTGEEFLPLALKYVKKNGVVHYYAFLKDEEVENYKKRIKEICGKEKKKCKIMNVVKAGQHAPYVFRVCFDVKINL